MVTYSIAAVGRRADSPWLANNLGLADASTSTDGTRAQATAGGQQACQSLNLPILCKGPDGSFGYYTLDAERSRAGAPVLLKV